MYFKDLLKLEKNEYGLMDYDELSDLLSPMPKEVLKQFCYDHGHKFEFQEQYSHLKINKLKWKEIEVKASDLINCSMYDEFSEYVNEVISRLDNFEKESFNCIDIRHKVITSWKEELTWLASPVFINASLLNKSNSLHLVEGHTRLGILKGLIKKKIVNNNSLHKIWFGDY